MRNPTVKTNFLKSLSSKLRTSCAVAALALLGATSVQAVPVTYTFEFANITAQMNGVDISGPATVTAIGDSDFRQTTDYPGGDGYLYTESVQSTTSHTFNFANFGTFSVLSPLYVFSAVDTYGYSYLGIRTDAGGFNYNETDTLPALYDLASGTSAGPMAGGENSAFTFDEMSTGGQFTTDANAQSGTMVFTAQVDSAAAVPEPASLSLFAGAGIALLAARRRKQAKKAV